VMMPNMGLGESDVADILRYMHEETTRTLHTKSIIGKDKSAPMVAPMEMPTLEGVVIWGLCDAASAALFYAHQDPRVTGLVLLNPWVRTQAGEAKVYLKRYYVQRLLDRAFWKKIVTLQWDMRASFHSLFSYVKQLLYARKQTTSESLILFPVFHIHPLELENVPKTREESPLLILDTF